MEDSQKTPRGIRNNNPLNLRRSSNEWLGKIREGSDKEFEQFVSIEYGIRAAFVNIRTIMRRNRGCTLRRLIEIWAPAFENNTCAYVNRVCARTKLPQSHKLDFKDKKTMCLVAQAMAEVENGRLLDIKNFERAYDMV